MSMRTITHVVLHYSATYADQEITAADIDKMHRDRGWKGIGYHYFIRRNGTLERGRPETQVGAHVGGKNSGKIGICCAGGLDRATGHNKGIDNRTPAQIETLVALIRDILKRHPSAEVVGHRDLAATRCPGFDVRTWWATVQHRKRPIPTPVAPEAPVHTPDVAEDGFHIVDVGDTWWSIAREHGLSVSDLLDLNDAAETDVLRIGARIDVEMGPGPVAGSGADDGPAPRRTLLDYLAAFLAKLFSRRT